MTSPHELPAAVAPLPVWKRHAGLTNAAAKLSGAGLAFLLTILLARSMDPAGFAQVSVTLAWLALATALGSVSMPLVAVRFVGESLAAQRPDLARGVLVFALSAALAATLLIIGVAALLALAGWLPARAHHVGMFELGLALLLPNVLLTVLAGCLQALHHALSAELLSGVLRSGLMLLGVIALWPASGHRLSPEAVMALYLGVSLLLLMACALLTYRRQGQTIGSSPRTARQISYAPKAWSHAALGVLAVLLVAAANERVDLLMLGWQAPASEVAVYAVAQRFAQTLLMATTAIAAVMAPQFVACLPALRGGDSAPARALVRESARLTLWVCLGAFMAFALVGPWLILLFGSHYQGAFGPLLILLAGQVLACLFGPALLLATLSGQTRFALISLLMGMLVNIVLNWMAVPHWGASGAALATTAGGLVCAVLAHTFVSRQWQLNTAVFPWAMRTPKPAVSP